MTGPLTDLTAFQRDLLVTLSKLGNASGLEVKRSIEQDGYPEQSTGRLYPNLDTLNEKGLITKQPRDRRTNDYSISRRGKRELKEHVKWLSESYDIPAVDEESTGLDQLFKQGENADA